MLMVSATQLSMRSLLFAVSLWLSSAPVLSTRVLNEGEVPCEVR